MGSESSDKYPFKRHAKERQVNRRGGGHVDTEAGPGATRPEAGGGGDGEEGGDAPMSRELPETGRSKDRTSPRAFRGNASLPTLSFGGLAS